MKRITPEMVVEAYKKTGWVPSRLRFDTPWGGCGLSVVAFTRDGNREAPGELIHIRLGITPEYRVGFCNGFDGCDEVIVEGNRRDFGGEGFELGLTDGCLAAMAVFGGLLDPVEPEKVTA